MVHRNCIHRYTNERFINNEHTHEVLPDQVLRLSFRRSGGKVRAVLFSSTQERRRIAYPACKRGSADVRPELVLGTRSHSPGRAPWVSMCTGCAHAVSGLGSRLYMHDVRDCTLVTLPRQS